MKVNNIVEPFSFKFAGKWEEEIELLTEGADPQAGSVVLEKFFHPNFRVCLSLKAQMAADTIQRLEFMPMLRII